MTEPATMQSEAMRRSGASPVRERGGSGQVTAPVTMQSEAMRRSGASDCAGDDAERSDEEERRN